MNFRDYGVGLSVVWLVLFCYTGCLCLCLLVSLVYFGLWFWLIGDLGCFVRVWW